MDTHILTCAVAEAGATCTWESWSTAHWSQVYLLHSVWPRRERTVFSCRCTGISTGENSPVCYPKPFSLPRFPLGVQNPPTLLWSHATDSPSGFSPSQECMEFPRAQVMGQVLSSSQCPENLGWAETCILCLMPGWSSCTLWLPKRTILNSAWDTLSS